MLSELEARAGCHFRAEIKRFLLTLSTDDLYRLLEHYSKKHDEGFLLDFQEHIRREYPTDEEARENALGEREDMRHEEYREELI